MNVKSIDEALTHLARETEIKIVQVLLEVQGIENATSLDEDELRASLVENEYKYDTKPLETTEDEVVILGVLIDSNDTIIQAAVAIHEINFNGQKMNANVQFRVAPKEAVEEFNKELK